MVGVSVNDLENELYRVRITEGLDILLGGHQIPNITVYKDATASSFQHWGILLGLSEGSMSILNFDGDD